MNSSESKSKYYVAAIVAFTTWGTFGIVLKSLAEYSPFFILYYRIILAAVLLTLFNIVFSKRLIKEQFSQFKLLQKNEALKYLVAILSGGLVLTFNWLLFIYVTNHISVKSAAFAYIVCPLLTTLLATLFLNEKLNKSQWFSISLILFSCIFLIYFTPADTTYSLLIALSYSIYLIIQRKFRLFHSLIVLNIQLLFSCLIIIPVGIFYVKNAITDYHFWMSISVVAIVYTIMPLLLNLFALKGLNSATTGILLYINPIVNFLIAVFYFHEKTLWFQWIAYTLVLISIVIFNFELLKQKTKRNK